MSTRIVAIREDGAELDITEAVVAVYDIAANGMEMGSGLLETHEVEQINALSRVLGTQRLDYQHDRCHKCSHARQDHGVDNGCHWGFSSTFGPQRACKCPTFVDLDAEESE